MCVVSVFDAYYTRQCITKWLLIYYYGGFMEVPLLKTIFIHVCRFRELYLSLYFNIASKRVYIVH